MKHPHTTRLCAVLLCLCGLAGCALNPQPSHGADHAPRGVSVYGTVDVGVGKTR